MVSDNSTLHTSTEYDRQVRKILPYYDCYHQETINLIKAMHLAPKIWLDTGCGTGNLIEKAAPQFPETQFVIADPSAAMLYAAKKKLYCFPNIVYLEAAQPKNSDT